MPRIREMRRARANVWQEMRCCWIRPRPGGRCARSTIWRIGTKAQTSADVETPFGHWVLQDLTKEPYAVQKAAGECGVRNLAYGNNTRQNYLVSYSEQAGKINFAVNQKLYTAAEGGTLADLDLLDALDYTT